MKRTNEAIERDLAALIKHGNDLRRDSAELSRTAKELMRKVARLNGVLARSAYLGRINESPASEGRDDRRTGRRRHCQANGCSSFSTGMIK